MTPMLFVLFALAAGVSVVVFGVLAYRRQQQLEQAFVQECSRLRYTYERQDDSLTSRWGGGPFGRGSGRGARHVVSGSCGGEQFLCFEYVYVTESGSGQTQSRQTHHFVVTVVPLPVAVPTLQVVPESLSQRVMGEFGIAHDYDVESDAFNRQFFVDSADAKFASDVLNPRQVESLLQTPDLAWRMQGKELLTWRVGNLQPQSIGADVPMLTRIVKQIPSFVWKDRGYHPNQPESQTEGWSKP